MAAILQNTCRKLRSVIGNEAIMLLNFTGDLQEILEQLLAIDAVIPSTDSVMDWSRAYYDRQDSWRIKVNEAAYRVCDMVDELQEMTVPAAGNKMGKTLTPPENVAVEPRSKEIMLGKMKEIKEALKELQKKSRKFDRVADTKTILGREKDVQNILAGLSVHRSSRQGPIILLICGKPGVGKATVAAMVFDNNRFIGYSRVWINLPPGDNPGLYEIAKCILSQLVSTGGEEIIGHGSYKDMNYITNRLHELLNGKKILIGLRNNSGWDIASELKGLKDVLGSNQVIVIATSETYDEDDDAMEIFGAQPYSLDTLSSSMCCKIMKQNIIRSQYMSADKEDLLWWIPPETYELCMGLPMAAQLYSNLLQNKHTVSEFQQIHDSYKHSKPEGPVEESINLSYNTMPPNLRNRKNRLLNGFQIWKLKLNLKPEKTEISVRFGFFGSVFGFRFGFAHPDSFTMHNKVHDFALTSSKDFLGVMDSARRYRNIPNCSCVLLLDLDGKPLDWIFKNQSTRALHCLGCTKMKFGDDSFSLGRGLRVLELHDESSLQKLPESICQLRQLGYLKLSGWSGLVTLPESIGGLINLLHIDLSSCSGLVNLPGSFGKLINLVHVSLSGCCKLQNLPESFGKLIKLVHINLSGSSALVHLPEFFGKLINLVHINLSGCLALANLPESIGELTKLEHINLSGCHALVNLPGSFGKLTKLEHINLSGCHKLVNLPGSFGKLTSLVHINLSSCYGLSKLPQSFGKLTNLAHINLSGCSVLEELPRSFGKLISLVYINLSNCSGLATLPGSFGDLPNLLHADLSHCYGLKLPESFGKLKKLVHLDLSFWSCFEGMQTILGGLTSLQHLNLSHPCCYRADYPHLKGLKQVLGQLSRLEHLNLSMFLNPIFCNQGDEENRQYIEFISGLSTLKYLDLSHNIFLRDLPESLACLRRLHTLDLSGCIKLKKVGKWMANMYSLKSVVSRHMESYHFVVGTDNAINNYGQLVDVICKELEITCLERMKSVAGRRIRLAKKQHLQKLMLSWNVRSEGTVEDNALLGELVPPHSLRYLELKGYSSTCFPSWLTSSSISSFNLVEVTMEDMPNCSHLPPLGLLPNLQQVVLRRMASITRIDACDLSGGHTAAFDRLSKFIIEDIFSTKSIY